MCHFFGCDYICLCNEAICFYSLRTIPLISATVDIRNTILRDCGRGRRDEEMTERDGGEGGGGGRGRTDREERKKERGVNKEKENEHGWE